MYSWCMSRLNGGVNKPYATVCQRKANLPVLPNILAIKQLQWERAKTVLVQRGIGWFRALRICSHSQYMFTYSRLLSLRLPALTYYRVLVGVYAVYSPVGALVHRWHRLEMILTSLGIEISVIVDIFVSRSYTSNKPRPVGQIAKGVKAHERRLNHETEAHSKRHI